MSTDFENELRSQLRATSAPDLGVDLDQVLEQGHRAVSRRSLLRGGAGLGVLAVVGLGGAALLQRPDAQPAEPPSDWVSVDFDRLPDSQGVEHEDEPALIRVEVNRAAIGSQGGTQPTVRFRFSDAKGAFDESWVGSDLPSRGMTWGTGSPGERHVLGIVVGQAAMIHFPEVGGTVLVTQAVPGTKLTAFVMRINDPAQTDKLDIVYWADTAGKVYDGFGTPMTTTTYELSPPVQVFVDEQAQWWGIHDDTRMVAQRIGSRRPDVVTLENQRERIVAVRMPVGTSDLEVQGGVGWTMITTEEPDMMLAARGPVATAPTLVWHVNGVAARLDL